MIKKKVIETVNLLNDEIISTYTMLQVYEEKAKSTMLVIDKTELLETKTKVQGIKHYYEFLINTKQTYSDMIIGQSLIFHDLYTEFFIYKYLLNLDILDIKTMKSLSEDKVKEILQEVETEIASKTHED